MMDLAKMLGYNYYTGIMNTLLVGRTTIIWEWKTNYVRKDIMDFYAKQTNTLKR